MMSTDKRLNPKIVAFCIAECKRQGAISGEAISGMLSAYEWSLGYASMGIWGTDITTLGLKAEPKKNHVNPPYHWRIVPVTFLQTVVRPPMPEEIRDLMQKWTDNHKRMTPEEATKELLDIHPLTDGNGRVAAIVYNWLKKTLEDPIPVPDFYSETYHPDESSFPHPVVKETPVTFLQNAETSEIRPGPITNGRYREGVCNGCQKVCLLIDGLYTCASCFEGALRDAAQT